MRSNHLPLLSPFVVLAIAVASLSATPLLLQRRRQQLRQPAVAALAASARAIGRLVDMSVQLEHLGRGAGPGATVESEEARWRLDRAFARYAAESPAQDLDAARQSFEETIPDAAADPGRVRERADRFTELLMDAIAGHMRQANEASASLEQQRSSSLQAASRLTLMWVLLACVGGIIAAVRVRRHQRSVAESRKLEQERARELEQFGARVAHDIVSPLAPVSLGVQLLVHKLEGDAEASEIAANVRRSLGKVVTIIDELLRFARAGARPGPGETADPSQVMDGLRAELLPAAERRGITLTFERPPEVRVACAEGAIAIVLQNLIGNAIKYIGDRPIKRIVARAVVVANRIRFSVHDSGPGIPRGMEEDVFEPYVRSPGVCEDGIGLGLATVKRLVEARNGRVGVWSDPRTGATFWVDLPLAATPSRLVTTG
jgi:signal transduction histidine kinase